MTEIRKQRRVSTRAKILCALIIVGYSALIIVGYICIMKGCRGA